MPPVRRLLAVSALLIAAALAAAGGAAASGRKTSPAPAPERGAAARLVPGKIPGEAGEFSLHGAALEDLGAGKAIRLTGKGWAEYLPAARLDTSGGSISFWIKPLWPETDQSSRTLLSMPWDDGRDGYLALSQGWWEPAGAGRLYFILSNQDHLHTSAPYRLSPGHWTHLAVTWNSGEGGGCRIYADGEMLARTDRPYFSSHRATRALIVGSDRGSSERKGRGMEALVSDLAVEARPLSDCEVRALFLADRERSEAAALKNRKWLDDGLKLPLRSRRDGAGTTLETRAIFDEDIGWATSRSATDAVLQRIKRAGFNVYLPCVWHGNGAYFASRVARPDARLKQRIDAGDDPLAYLIAKAHGLGIEVHPWFTVVKRSTDGYPEYHGSGTPEGAFDVHNGRFRDFIGALMLDVVRRYDVDGVNLDYVRTMGLCTCASCRADYQKESGFPFRPDYSLREVSGPARDRLQSWQDKAVSDIVSGFSTAARGAKPGLIISVDGHPQPKEAIRPLQGRNEVLWANSGWIDVIFAMNYDERVDVGTVDRVRAELQEPRRLIVLFGNYDNRGPGAASRPGRLVDDYAQYARRKWPGSGVAFYLYGRLSDDQIETLARGAFMNKALPSWPKREGVHTGIW